MIVGLLSISSLGAASAAPPTSLDTIYASSWTGAAYASPGPARVAVDPSDAPPYECASAYTGAVTVFRYSPCSSPAFINLDAEAGPEIVCVNNYTDKIRYTPSGSCLPSEYEALLPTQ